MRRKGREKGSGSRGAGGPGGGGAEDKTRKKMGPCHDTNAVYKETPSKIQGGPGQTFLEVVCLTPPTNPPCPSRPCAMTPARPSVADGKALAHVEGDWGRGGGGAISALLGVQKNRSVDFICDISVSISADGRRDPEKTSREQRKQ